MLANISHMVIVYFFFIFPDYRVVAQFSSTKLLDFKSR